MKNDCTISKEVFSELEEKALQKKSRYDYFYISSKAGMVSLPEYGRCRIKNSFIYVQMGANLLEWEISNYRLSKCSGTFIFCVKNVWNIAISVGTSDEETVYLHFKDMAEKEPIDFWAIGALETEEFAYAFCFDWKVKKNFYIAAERVEAEESDLFSIINAAKNFTFRKDLNNEQNLTSQEFWSFQGN